MDIFELFKNKLPHNIIEVIDQYYHSYKYDFFHIDKLNNTNKIFHVNEI